MEIPAQHRGAPLAAPSRMIELLSHAPIFRGLCRDDIARIARGASQVHAERGMVLFHRGAECRGFHLVAFGQVKLAVGTAGGAERVIEILGAGGTFGEAVMFTGMPYPVTATMLADSLLVHVSRDVLYAEIDHDPRLAHRMLAGLSQRLHVMVKDLEALTLRSGMQRVIGYLLSLVDEAQAGGSVTLPAQKSLVASRLNVTPEYFSRILHDLSAAGLVRIDGRRIDILDPEGLRSFGTSDASGAP